MITIPELYELYLRHPVISTDTRTLPEGCLFFALKGPNFNGNSFAKKALQSGAAYAIVDENAGSDPRILRTTDVLSTLQQLANYHRHRLDIHVLAITGSNGKTIVKEWLFHCLSDIFSVTRSPKSYNSQVGVPLSVLLMETGYELGIFEAGIS